MAGDSDSKIVFSIDRELEWIYMIEVELVNKLSIFNLV